MIAHALVIRRAQGVCHTVVPFYIELVRCSRSFCPLPGQVSGDSGCLSDAVNDHPPAFSGLRVYAISGGNKAIATVVVLLAVAPCAISIVRRPCLLVCRY